MKKKRRINLFTIIIFLCLEILVSFPMYKKFKNKNYNEFSDYHPIYNTKYCDYVYDSNGEFIYSRHIDENNYKTLLTQVDKNAFTEYNRIKNMQLLNDNEDEYQYQNNTDLKLFSKYSCLIDASTKEILYQKDCFNKVPNASTTKILTCIVALENGNLDDVVTASQYAASMPDVQLNMKPAEQFYLKDLLYSLMLESHNDTAVAIAEHIGGSVENFAKMMNDKASLLGCKNSNFVTPNGLDDDNHYTCSYDLCLIAAYALNNDTFRQIISTPAINISNVDNKTTYSLNNKDRFLTMYEGALGIKTGFTSKAGYCFVGAANINSKTYISCVLACGWPPDKNKKWQDTVALMNYAKNNLNNDDITIKADTCNKMMCQTIAKTDIGLCLNSLNTKNNYLSNAIYENEDIKLCPYGKNIQIHVITYSDISDIKCVKDTIGMIVIENDGFIYYKNLIKSNFRGTKTSYKDVFKSVLNNYI